MDPVRWRDVKYVFTSALEQPASALGAFLDQACGQDAELRTEVNRLLVEHFNAGDFLEEPLSRRRETPAPTFAAPVGEKTDRPFSGTARFELRTKLGSGGFGDVYEAFDRERHVMVALKYLRTFEPEQLYRLKKEFRALTDIRHTNLVHVYQLFSGSEPPFFTMELLKGRDFGHYLRAADRATGSSHLLGQLLLQLCEGVIALHEAQLLHRDIKPSNVFVTNEGRVVLLDFGLVADLSVSNSGTTTALAGTPYYLAPEQIDGERLTEATDWYAVGVMLYEAITARLPFEGSVVDVLSRKRDEEAVPPSTFVAGIPPDLDFLCRRLLRRDPAARPGGYEVRRVLQRSVSVGTGPGAERGRSSRTFVCREPHLMALRRAFDDTDNGSLVCVHVRGASGVGKTALVKRFLSRIQEARPGCVVLSGRCYESESAPHKGLDELVDNLARFLKRLDPSRVQALLPRYFVLLTRLFPVLQEFRAAGRALPEIPDPREQRHRAFGCLRECLGRISATSPLILWIDDLQWSDSDTVRLLNDLVQSADPFSCLILLTYRDNDTATSPLLAALERPGAVSTARVTNTVLEIENLLYEEARELAELLIQEASPTGDWRSTAAEVARESKGNPYFVTELVRYALSLADHGNLSAGAFGIGHVIKRRVGLLPEPALRLLELIAVAGQPLPSDVCVKAGNLGDAYHDIRSILIREHLLRPHVSQNVEKLDLYHDQIREAVTGYLSREATAVYHGLLADALESTASADHERLAFHFEAVGNRQKAIRYTTIAAKEAEDALAFDRAARLYRRILDMSELSARDQQDVLERLAAALSNAGRGKEAAETFLQASEGSSGAQRLDLRRRACEQYLRSGHMDMGVALSRTLLHEVGISYLDKEWRVLVSLLWRRLQLRLRTLAVGWRTSPTTASNDDRRMMLDICWTVAVGMSMVDVLRGADFQARYTLLALRTGEPSRVALGLAAELAAGSIGGRRSQATIDELYNTALDLATRTGDDHAIGFVMSMRGAAAWLTGDWAGCHERNSVAAGIYRDKCSGVVWELTTANTFSLSALVFLGRWREHSLAVPDLIQQAHARGDRYGAISLPLLAYAYVDHLAVDQPAQARAMIDEALSAWHDDGFHVQHCDALFGQMDVLLYEGDALKAWEHLNKQWPRLALSNQLQIQFNRIQVTALRGRAALALARALNRARGSGETPRLMRAAKKDARFLTKVNAPWGVALGTLLEAGIATSEGRWDDARRRLEVASGLFEAARMDHYLAVTRLRLSQLQPALQQAKSQSDTWFDDQGIRNSARVAEMLAPGAWSARAQTAG